MKPSDIILGTAVRYSPEQVLPFVFSLGKTGYRGRLVLFVEDTDSPFAERFRELSVEVRPAGVHDIPFNSSRYFTYLDFLRNEPAVERVIISDVRDVYFQADPMRACPGNSLYCYEEDVSMSIGTCRFNSQWIREAYGGEELRRLEHRRIICSGVTGGTRALILDYLTAMCHELERMPPVWGIDQAVHDHLVYSDAFPSCEVVPNESGAVYTLAYVDPERLRTGGGCRVLNAHGLPAIVHQYDRHPGLARKVQETFSHPAKAWSWAQGLKSTYLRRRTD